MRQRIVPDRFGLRLRGSGLDDMSPTGWRLANWYSVRMQEDVGYTYNQLEEHLSSMAVALTPAEGNGIGTAASSWWDVRGGEWSEMRLSTIRSVLLEKAGIDSCMTLPLKMQHSTKDNFGSGWVHRARWKPGVRVGMSERRGAALAQYMSACSGADERHWASVGRDGKGQWRRHRTRDRR